MWKNYLTIAYRNLLRQKGHTAINVFGLALALACGLLIALFAYDEFAYDRFHEKADRLYFVSQEHEFSAETNQVMDTQLPLARAMERDIAGVETAATTTWAVDYWPVRRPATGQEVNYPAMYADSTFLTMFTFPLLGGDPETALEEPNSVVITEEMARALFGEEDPMGGVLELEYFSQPPQAFTVTGVLAPPPKNSFFDFEAVASLSSLPGVMSQGWNASNYLTFAELAEGASLAAVEEGLEGLVRTHLGEEREVRYPLIPITQLYLSELTDNEGFRGSARYLVLFSSVALFVLLVALINYMNLATARAATRLREVGIRKTLGASRAQVARQFLAEAVLVASAALLVGLGIAALALPLFNGVFGKELSLAVVRRPEGLLLGLGLALGIGLLAGSYPALYLSGFDPVRILKREGGGRGGAAGLRRGLVVVQFAVTVELLMATAVVYRQLQYVHAPFAQISRGLGRMQSRL